MRVGVYQNLPFFGQVDTNIENAIRDLSSVEADLIVLPELFNTGYQFVSRQEVEDLSEDVPSGKTCQAMMKLARDRDMFLVFGLAERAGSRVYNSAAIAGPRSFVGIYRKTHLFAEEKYFFDPGDTGFRVFDLGPARIGVMICFDWIFPESARVLTLLGADVICHPANLVLPHCQAAMRTRSIENSVFSLTANRIGTESRGGKNPLRFTGNSQILDSQGRHIAGMGDEDTGVVIVDIDPKEARDKSVTAQNDRLKDRRTDFYKPLTDQP